MTAYLAPNQEYGFWTTIQREERHKWLCLCKCGNRRIIGTQGLLSGRTKSCGCGVNRITNRTHGLSRDPFYGRWKALRHRCLLESHESFVNYGGRGIKVCDLIRNSPQSLIDIIGLPPTGLTIDRVDNNGNYSCGSCRDCISNKWTMNLRWATQSQQCRNTRFNRKVRFNGVDVTLSELSEITGINRSTLQRRIERGESGSKMVRPAKYSKKKACK